MTGTRPVIDFMFADFIMDAVGETINQIAKMQYMSSGRIKMPVLLRGCVGIGHSAATHHSGNYYHMYGHFPGLRVVVPSNAYDAKGLMKRALNCDDPVMFLEHRELLTTKAHVPAVKARQTYVADFADVNIGLKNKMLCDIGAGEGQFLEIITGEDYQAKAFGIEPSEKNCNNLSESGFNNFNGTIEEYAENGQYEGSNPNLYVQNQEYIFFHILSESSFFFH